MVLVQGIAGRERMMFDRRPRCSGVPIAKSTEDGFVLGVNRWSALGVLQAAPGADDDLIPLPFERGGDDRVVRERSNCLVECTIGGCGTGKITGDSEFVRFGSE